MRRCASPDSTAIPSLLGSSCVYCPSCLQQGSPLTQDTKDGSRPQLPSLRRPRAPARVFSRRAKQPRFRSREQTPTGSPRGYHFGASCISVAWSCFSCARIAWSSASGDGDCGGGWSERPHCSCIRQPVLPARLLRRERLALLRLVQWNLPLHLTLASRWKPTRF